MTLEQVLDNLTTLVDYGTAYFKNLNSEPLLSDLAGWDLDDILSELGISNYKVVQYVTQNSDLLSDIICDADKSDLRDIISSNYDIDDFINIDWRY